LCFFFASFRFPVHVFHSKRALGRPGAWRKRQGAKSVNRGFWAPAAGSPTGASFRRREGASLSLWRRRRSLKLAPLGRPKATASAAQAPQPPLPMDQKDRLRQAATRHGRCSRARDLSSGLALPFCLPGLGAPHTTAFS